MSENLLPSNSDASSGLALSSGPVGEPLSSESADNIRPETFSLRIHSGMLETMGHNMYSSVAKCLAEFVANAYDADADNVEIDMDFERIDAAKNIVRANARAEKSAGKRKNASAVYDPLPSDITIRIRDDGHGMNAQEIQNCFLAITRNRRIDEMGQQTLQTSESGLRKVMGRKGVGKLAGFGAAEHIRITSKRSGQTYSTSFEMDYSQIKSKIDISANTFEAVYVDELPEEEHFTEVVLSNLRCDSMKSSPDTINVTLARTFCILDTSFCIKINGVPVEEEKIDWEYTYPPNATLKNMGIGSVFIDPEDKDSAIEFQYIIRFRARPKDHGTDEQTTRKRASLPAERRGARIYAHGRLAHGPSLLDLHSGVHNFHAQDYMECIVLADSIDEYEHDFIVTSREGLNKDNPVVSALSVHVTDLMKIALTEHSKFRDVLITTAIEEDDYTKRIMVPIHSLNSKSQKAAKEILKVIGKEHGVKSEIYMEMAPILLQAVNSSEVLTRLIELETNPVSIRELANSMADLTRMERSDLLKLYRGRSKAINALQKLHDEGNTTRKGKGFEKELHMLLKENPWLVNVTYSNFLTSDRQMGDVCRELNRVLEIDDDAKNITDETRPDLVYVAANSVSCEKIIIVELKSPGIDLVKEHLEQLTRYIRKTEQHLRTKFHERKVEVVGYLIGKKPSPDSKGEGQQDLIYEMNNFGTNSSKNVIDLLELVVSAKQAHEAGIQALQKEEEEEEEE
ncbi:TPA: ATP-binding protein [Klebsiella variicola]|uniref:ATP-binding protein n=1 Tax=Klebsiella variicola TaxID=244366 RepID=UPI0009838091|nr:ATP-binding protein [Klebsiella variicola]HBS5904816.1 ATP-binding protein [Klebsiella variicola]